MAIDTTVRRRSHVVSRMGREKYKKEERDEKWIVKTVDERT